MQVYMSFSKSVETSHRYLSFSLWRFFTLLKLTDRYTNPPTMEVHLSYWLLYVYICTPPRCHWNTRAEKNGLVSHRNKGQSVSGKCSSNKVFLFPAYPICKRMSIILNTFPITLCRGGILVSTLSSAMRHRVCGRCS